MNRSIASIVTARRLRRVRDGRGSIEDFASPDSVEDWLEEANPVVDEDSWVAGNRTGRLLGTKLEINWDVTETDFAIWMWIQL